MNTRASVEEAIEVYAQTVYGVALTHTTCKVDADDVFQEVFYAYWHSRPAFNDEEHRKAWLIRTTLNFCLKTTQSTWAKKTVPLPEDTALEASGENAEDHAFPHTVELPQADFSFQTEQQMALYEALRGLSTSYRTALHLFYFEDLSVAQIAALLGEEQGTVKTRLSRARVQLREKMQGGN